MTDRDALHSAQDHEEPAEPVEFATFNDGIAFRWDIFGGLPAEYAACDVFYIEPPWEAGFGKFEVRAGITPGVGRTYTRLMRQIGRIVAGIIPTRPVIVITGQSSLKYFPAGGKVFETIIHGYPRGAGAALALVYGVELERTDNTRAIVDQLAERYECVGDFCCGYGRAALQFHRAGKHFVVSDYNPSCIGYMVDHWPG